MDRESVSVIAQLLDVPLSFLRLKNALRNKRAVPWSKADKDAYVPTAILCCALLVSNQEHAQPAHYLPNFRLILNQFTQIRCLMLTPRVSW